MTAAVKSKAEEEWRKAAAVLVERPSLMTSQILNLTLQSRPPVHAIQFMLSLNPSAALPDDGPCALEIAMREGASGSVVEAILRACPEALKKHGKDAIGFAEMRRPDLLPILKRPLSYWTGMIAKDIDVHTGAETRSQEIREEELENIKMIASSVLRAHKKLVRTTSHQFDSLRLDLNELREEQTQELTKQQRLVKTHMLALEMKERAHKAKLQRMERRMLARIEGRYPSINNNQNENAGTPDESRQDEHTGVRDEPSFSTDSLLKATTTMRERRLEVAQREMEARTKDLCSRLDRECSLNATFRHTMTYKTSQLERRMEETEATTQIYYSTPYERDCYNYSDDEPLVPVQQPTGSCLPLWKRRRRIRMETRRKVLI